MGRYSAARDLDLETKARWYVVANRTDAVLYEDERGSKFKFLNRICNRKTNLIDAALLADEPNDGLSNTDEKILHHALSRKTPQHEQLAKKFAKQIAANLEIAYRQKRFKDLVLVAEPHFLGLLRNALNEPVLEAVRHEVRREYAQGSDRQLRELILKAIETGK